MPPRRCPPPWTVEEMKNGTHACFIVRDKNEQGLGYFYFEEEPGRRMAASMSPRTRRGAPHAVYARIECFSLEVISNEPPRRALGLCANTPALSSTEITRMAKTLNVRCVVCGIAQDQVRRWLHDGQQAIFIAPCADPNRSALRRPVRGITVILDAQSRVHVRCDPSPETDYIPIQLNRSSP